MSDCDTELRWGIVGCANIARKVIAAMKLAPRNTIIAVASRDIEKAKAFATENDLGGATAYGSYDALLADASVDAVYLPLPTTLHLEWVTKAAAAKKHILLEKPVAINATQFIEMRNRCNEANVVLMDGTMFMHHDRLKNLINEVKCDAGADACAAPRRIHSSFSFLGGPSFFENNIRVKASADPLGSLGDLGWYCTRAGLMVYSAKQLVPLPSLAGAGEGGGSYESSSLLWPKSCSAICTRWADDGKVPVEVEARVDFDDNKMMPLVFDSSFCLPLRQTLEVSCPADGPDVRNRVYALDDFVLPVSDTGASFTCSVDPTPGPFTKKESTAATPEPRQIQQVQMISEFRRLALSDPEVCAKHKAYWQQVSLITQSVMDACLESILNGGRDVPVLQHS